MWTLFFNMTAFIITVSNLFYGWDCTYEWYIKSDVYDSEPPRTYSRITITWVTVIETWWRHQMETFSALLAICAGNSSIPGEFPTQRPMTRICDVFFDLRLNKRLNKQSWDWWFERLSHPLWRQCNVKLGILVTAFLLYISDGFPWNAV